MVRKFLLLLLFTPGCMLYPFDGQTITSRSTSILFEGYDSTQGTDIDVQIRNPTSGAWTRLTGATTSERTNYRGDDYYKWTVNAAIPAASWKSGAKSGHFARVRAVRAADGSRLTSVAPDWADCAGRWPAVGQFLTHCDGPHNPEAYLYTQGYPAGADMVINDIFIRPSGLSIVTVNAGRDAYVEKVDCVVGSVYAQRIIDETILPGEARTFVISSLGYYPGMEYNCAVVSRNPDGSPETTLTDNQFIERL